MDKESKDMLQYFHKLNEMYCTAETISDDDDYIIIQVSREAWDNVESSFLLMQSNLDDQ